MKAAAEGLRDVSFELGGKNSAIIFADADLDAAIEGIVRSVFLHCGQVCLGTERVLVERPLFDRLVRALQAKADALRPGHPDDKATSFGTLISSEPPQEDISHSESGPSDGARVVPGGREPQPDQEE